VTTMATARRATRRWRWHDGGGATGYEVNNDGDGTMSNDGDGATGYKIDDDGDDDDYGDGRWWRRRNGWHVNGNYTMATARRAKKLNCFTVEKINCHLLQIIVPLILLVKLSLTRTIRVTIKCFIICTRNNI
jgi:hypothetical protein